MTPGCSRFQRLDASRIALADILNQFRNMIDHPGDNFFTLTIGAGYRILLSDSLAWRLDVRDHIFDRDAFGNSETTNNIELSTGFTYYF